MSIYTDNQSQYIDAFMSQVDALLKHTLNEADENGFLETLSTIVDSLSAGISLVSLVTAVPTLGASVGIGSACIILLKTGNSIYQYVRSHTDNDNTLEGLALDKEQRKLSLFIVLRQTAYGLAIKYAHAINDLIEPNEIEHFAQFAFARVMSRLTTELKAQKAQPAGSPLIFPKAATLIHALASNSQFSVFFDTKKINLKKDPKEQTFFSFFTQSNIATKLLYARPRIAVYNQFGAFSLYASKHESTVKLDSTLPQCGVVSVSESYLDETNLVIKKDQLKPLTDIKTNSHALLKRLYIEYVVTRQDVEEYLTYIRLPENKESLNTYLSKKLNARIIANCHDDTLIGLDLNGGDFSEVNFSQANLAQCNLAKTNWSNSHLEETKFENNNLDGAIFIGAYLERSQWLGLDIMGDLSGARMNGAHLIDCNLNQTLQQHGCNWELCIRERVTVNHEQITFNLKIEEELSRELRERIKQGVELHNRLDTLLIDVRSLHAADESFNQRLTELERENDVLCTIKRHWETWFNTTAYKEAKKTYVELHVSCLIDGKNTVLPFGDRLDRFIQSDDRFFLIRGEVGCGKTLTANVFQEDLLRRYKHDTNWVPAYIKLNEVSLTEENFALAVFKKIFSQTQLYALSKYRWVLILDGLDECSFPLKQRRLLEECSHFAEQLSLDLKVVVLAQTRFLLEFEQDYHELLSTLPKVSLKPEYECAVLPPNTKQIEQVLRASHLDAESTRAFKNLQHLFNTPLMFKIIITLLLEESHASALPESRAKLYDKFCENWFNHIKNKLPPEVSSETNLQFHIQRLAFEMFESGAYWLERPYHHSKQNRQRQVLDPLSHLFEHEMNRVSPLIMTICQNQNNQEVMRYEFIHHSFSDYALAQKLFNDFLDEKLDIEDYLKNWRYRALCETPDVLNFLQEFIKDHPEKTTIQNHLLTMVLASQSPQFNIANVYSASNAMSVLCRLGFDFCGYNLSHIRIPKADLTEAILPFVDLSYSDLTEVCFHKAILFKSNLDYTILDNARYFNAPSFLQAADAPKTFAIYPSTAETIVAYDVPPKPNSPQYQIAIARLSDGKVYQHWPAHGQMINALAWTTHQGTARLASAGVGGTIRIWQMTESDMPPKEIAKLQNFKNKCEIIGLTWFNDGNLLAIYSVDQIVRIWNVNEKKRVFKSSQHAHRIHTLITNNRSNGLISADEGGIIRIWSNPLEKSSPTKIYLRKILPEQQISKIQSMALSLDEDQLALGCDNGDILTIAIARPKGSAAFRIGHKKQVLALLWTEHALISTSLDGTLRIWRNQDDAYVFGHDDPIHKIELAGNGHQLISGGGGKSTHIYAWNITNPQYNRIEAESFGHVSCMASHQSHHTHYVAAGFANGSAIIWQLDCAKKPLEKSTLCILEHALAPITHLQWSKDGQYLALMGQDKSVYIYKINHDIEKFQDNRKSVRCIHVLDNLRFSNLHWLNIQEHQHHLALGCSDGNIYLFDCAQLDFADKTRLSVKDCHLIIADREKRQASPMRSKNDLSIQCFSVAPHSFDSNCSWIISSQAQKLFVWILRQREIETFMEPVPHPGGHATRLEWSPSGHYFASNGSDQTIYIWDAVKCICLLIYEQQDTLRSLLWHQKWLIAATSKQMLIWELPAEANWQQRPKEVAISTSLLKTDKDNLLIAKDQGIYLMNFTHVCDGTIRINGWVGALKRSLVLDHCTLTNTKNLSVSNITYVRSKGAKVSSDDLNTSYFQRLLNLFQTPAKPAIELLPPPAPTSDMLKRFGIYAPNTQELPPAAHENNEPSAPALQR